MRKSYFWGLLFAVMALIPVQNAFAEYCTTPNSGSTTHSRNDRGLTSFSFTDGVNSVAVTDVQTNVGSYWSPSYNVYVDKTSSVLETSPGATISLSQIAWGGIWMHGYIYVDYDKDEVFNQDNELVSYNFYSADNSDAGVDSNGNSVSSNCNVTASNMPSFRIPSDLAEGQYRLRFKIDWNSKEPCGNPDSNNSLSQNGGCMADITLNVLKGLPERTISVDVVPAEGGVVTGAGTSAGNITLTATPNLGYDFVNWTLEGEVVGTEVSYTDATEGDKTYTANFAAKTAYPTMSYIYTNGMDQTNRYLKEVTATAGETVTTVFSATTVAELPQEDPEVIGSTATNGAYVDKTANPIIVPQGTEEISVNFIAWPDAITAGTGTATVQLNWTQQAVFIDWNNNYEFYEAGENYGKNSDDMPNASFIAATGYTRTFAVPADVQPGTYRMRVCYTEPESNTAQWQNSLFEKGNCRTRNGKTYDFAIQVIAPETPVYNITVSVNDDTMGSAAKSAEESVYTLTATANEGYEFVNWTLEGTEVSTEATYTFTAEADAEYVANFQAIAQWPATMALIEQAKTLIVEDGVGYPSATAKATFKEALDAAEGDPTIAALAPLQSAIDAYIATEDIVLPEVGKTYAMVLAETETSYLYINNSNGTLEAIEYDGTSELPQTAYFTVGTVEGKTTFQSVVDGKYMAIPSNVTWLTSESQSVTGISESAGVVAQFEVIKLASGAFENVTASAEQLFGMVYLYGSRGIRTDNGSAEPGVIIVNNSTNAFDKSGAPFCNGSFTSAIRMVEVELPTPAPVPAIVVTNDAVNVERQFTFDAYAEGAKIQIDWGNGELQEYEIAYYDNWTTWSTTVTGTILGEGVVKIYGDQIHMFDCSYVASYPVNVTSLDLTGCPNLYELVCNSNGLTSLDLSANTALSKLTANNSAFAAGVDLSANTALTSVDFNDAGLTSVDFSNNTALTTIKVNNNNLGSIDVSANTALTTLYANNTGLTSIDLSANTALKNLYVNNNLLTSLDISKMVAGSYTFANDNKLTELITASEMLSSKTCINVLRNNFTLATLPVISGINAYNYAPQQAMTIATEINEGEELDLSSEAMVGENATVYTWYTAVDNAEFTNYTVENGKFVFDVTEDTELYCTMTTAAFPSFSGANALTTTNILVKNVAVPVTISVATNNEYYGTAAIDGVTGTSTEVMTGDEVTVVATPAESYVDYIAYEFEAWTAGTDTISTENPYTFNAAEALSLTANFGCYMMVNVTASEGGSAYINDAVAEATVKLPYQSKATLHAVANEGYEFSHWTYTTATGTETVWNESTADQQFTVGQYTAFTAYFVPVVVERTVTFKSNNMSMGYVTIISPSQEGTGAGTGTGTGTGTGGQNPSITTSEDVTAQAFPQGNTHEFVNWTIDGVEVGTETTYTYTGSEDVTIQANFKLKGDYCTVTVNSNGGGNVAIQGYTGYSAQVVKGTEVTVVATPNAGYAFVSWTDANDPWMDDITYNAEYTFTVTENITLEAWFESAPTPTTYAVTVQAAPTSDYGTVAIQGAAETTTQIEANTSVTVVATPAEGYALEGWYDVTGATLLSTDLSYTFTVTAETTVVAWFMEATLEEPEYCTDFGTSTRSGGRYMESLTFSDGANETTISVNQQNGYGAQIYFDKTDVNVSLEATKTITSNVNWRGEWMHSYLFVDWNNDGEFTRNLGTNLVPEEDSELIAFSFWSGVDGNSQENEGYNSAGQYITGDARSVWALPEFTIPTSVAEGTYRARLKIDWNTADPCSVMSAGDAPCVVDFMITVTYPDGIADADADAVQVYAANGVIYINGYEGDVKVVNAAGQVVKDVMVNGAEQLNVNAGLYMVVTGDKVTKVVVK